MKTEAEIREKLRQLESDLIKREKRWNPFFLTTRSKKNLQWIDYLKNNIAFIKWALNEEEKPIWKCVKCGRLATPEEIKVGHCFNCGEM